MRRDVSTVVSSLMHETLVRRYQRQVAQVDGIGDQIAMLQAQRTSNTYNQVRKSDPTC
jgi:hypothetical protein